MKGLRSVHVYTPEGGRCRRRPFSSRQFLSEVTTIDHDVLEDPIMVILSEDMIRMIREQRLAYVASISPDGFPKVSPKGSLRVWDESHLVFVDIDSPKTVENLSKNPRTEVNVVDPFLRKGFRFSGNATVLNGGDLFSQVLGRYKAEGADISRVRWAVLIDVTSASPLVSPAYAAGLTEEDVRRLWEEYYAKSTQKIVLDLVPPNDF
jgi:uncharacterized protein